MAITFLFGSGADTDAVKELPSGMAFAEVLLTEKYYREVKTLLNVDISKFKILHPKSTKIFVQTVYKDEINAKRILGQDAEKCIKYYRYKENLQEAENIQYDEIRAICSKWYKAILESEDNEIRKYFLSNAVFFDFLDEKFNSLRYLDENSNAIKVMKAYTITFVLLIKKLYVIKEDFEWTYENVFDLLKNGQIQSTKANCYYETVKKVKDEYYLATPNYTNLAKKITGKDIAYLHGNLQWFEDLEKLMVYDCVEEREKIDLSHRIIPFILIPSGIKPIICGKQLRQFSKFMSDLNESNVLCIIGYRFNSEDNHINSLISEWLNKENSRMVYFNFSKKGDEIYKISMEELPWWDKNIKCETKDFKELKIDDIDSYKVINIDVNEDNSNEAFERFIDIYNERN